MIDVGLFGLAVVREVFPETRNQRHIPETVGRWLSCLLRAHQIDRPGFAPGILHLETGARSRHHVVRRGGCCRVVPKRCHRNTIVTRRTLLLVLLHIRILFEAYLKRNVWFMLLDELFCFSSIYLIIKIYKLKVNSIISF